MINNNHNVDDNNHNETDTVTVEDNNTVADTLDEEGGSYDIYASYSGRCWLIVTYNLIQVVVIVVTTWVVSMKIMEYHQMIIAIRQLVNMIALLWLRPPNRIDEKILHDSGDRLSISLGDFMRLIVVDIDWLWLIIWYRRFTTRMEIEDENWSINRKLKGNVMMIDSDDDDDDDDSGEGFYS